MGVRLVSATRQPVDRLRPPPCPQGAAALQLRPMSPAKARQIKFICLRDVATVHRDSAVAEKPMLVGFARAEDLSRVAKAPSFSEDDPNQAIAQMLQKLPVRKWQRPLDLPRITQMAGFFSHGGLMPNPVLL